MTRTPAIRLISVLLTCTVIAACKVEITVPEGGSVTSESGVYTCAAGMECLVKVEDVFFDETFSAIPDEGFEFKGWKKRERSLCGERVTPCQLFTSGFAGNESLLAILESDDVFYLEPIFEASADEAPARVGFEILEIISATNIRAWISSDITREEFDALELPSGWVKNQPREGDVDASRFLRSPDAEEEGEILEAELFGFSWWHSATVTESNIALDEEGLLNGSRVLKFHEVTFNAGSTIVTLTSPEAEVYFRIGRDADRVSDNPSIPNLWHLGEYTTPEQLVIQLLEETLVIRTDNEDSFQGPVPELSEAR